MPNPEMEPTLLSVYAIMSPRSAAHCERWADDFLAPVLSVCWIEQLVLRWHSIDNDSKESEGSVDTRTTIEPGVHPVGAISRIIKGRKDLTTISNSHEGKVCRAMAHFQA